LNACIAQELYGPDNDDGDEENDATRSWFSHLPADVQLEIYVQKEVGLRPHTRWIMGPYDHIFPVWQRRFDMGEVVIPQVTYDMGSEDYDYVYAAEMRNADFRSRT